MHAILEISADVPSFAAARVCVMVERVPYADRRSEVIMRASRTGIAHRNGTETHIPVEFDLSDITDWSHVIVRAHVDVDCDGLVNVHDLLTMQCYRLQANSQVVRLEMKLVT